MSDLDRVNLAHAFLADDIPATDNISNDESCLLSLAQSDYVVPVAPMPRFPFSAAMTEQRYFVRSSIHVAKMYVFLSGFFWGSPESLDP